jgi:hypothetical protein
MIKLPLQPQILKKLHLHRKRVDEVHIVAGVRPIKSRNSLPASFVFLAELPRDISPSAHRPCDLARIVFFFEDVVLGKLAVLVRRVVVGRERRVEQRQLRGQVVDLVEVRCSTLQPRSVTDGFNQIENL